MVMMPSQHSCSSCLHSPTEALLIPASCVGCVQLGPCLLQVPVPADLMRQHREAWRGRRAPADGQSAKGEEREKGRGGRTQSLLPINTSLSVVLKTQNEYRGGGVRPEVTVKLITTEGI